ncbi:hypothetical protein D187_005356 [Cystobacter fuscus DSM 2262]|uniref:Uncharacterized protein n=2 Tax=Cystobacter fuscus TaxID=43 RepID=S9PP24_CYSF2|nr:hypothetical protein D187_005356 [Cystobacter fuscus DSM 2262]
MEEVEQFEAVLRELGELMIDLGDLASSVVLIGGQVLALESRRRGQSGVIAVETETGEEVTRGFTFEPDLLFDLDGTEFMAGRLPEVLKERGYERARQFRWSKKLRGSWVQLDLFAPEEVEPDDLPTAIDASSGRAAGPATGSTHHVEHPGYALEDLDSGCGGIPRHEDAGQAATASRGQQGQLRHLRLRQAGGGRCRPGCIESGDTRGRGDPPQSPGALL